MVDLCDCTGCAACANVCPVDCIRMVPDDEGFLIPEINAEACIHCSKCDKVCPADKQNGIEKSNDFIPEVYAAWSLNDGTRLASTSGGVFSELSEYLIAQGGSIFAVKYQDDFTIEHTMIVTVEKIPEVRNSKYAQSNKKYIYRQVKDQLRSAVKAVLFVGAPCEVAGLYHFLGQRYANLITCDFVCRGANSPMVFTNYLQWLKEKYCSEITKVWFKNKAKGWNLFSTQISFANGKTYRKDRYHDLFMRGYIERNLFMRNCCASCQFRSTHHMSDLTLADFWGIGNYNPRLDDNRGTSMVIINSETGKALFEKIQGKIFSQKTDFEMACAGNRCITHQPVINPDRAAFFKRLRDHRFDHAIKPFLQTKRMDHIKRAKLLIGISLKRIKRCAQSNIK